MLHGIGFIENFKLEGNSMRVFEPTCELYYLNNERTEYSLNIKELYLAGNNISAMISMDWIKCSGLEYLDLTYNQIQNLTVNDTEN